MAVFKYEAIDNKSGLIEKGELYAESRTQARKKLRERNFTPVEIDDKAGARQGSESVGSVGFGLMSGKLSFVTRQFAGLMEAQIPLERALKALMEQAQTRKLREALTGVYSGVLEGRTLSDSMAGYPRMFSELYRKLIEAGEKSGELDKVLVKLADFIDQSQDIKRSMVLAFIYPAIVTFVAFMAVAGLLVYVVPKVVVVFKHSNQELPWLTKALIFISEFIIDYGLFLLLAGIIIGVIVNIAMKTESFRFKVHSWLLKLPVIGELVKGFNSVRLSSALAVLVGGSVPLNNALEICTKVLSNLPMRKALEEATTEVVEGSALATGLENSGMFPPVLVQFIASGEETDQLGAMLEKTARQQYKELEYRVATFTSLLEPVMILVMGMLVLLIVLAILMPIFEMNQLVR